MFVFYLKVGQKNQLIGAINYYKMVNKHGMHRIF